MRFTNSIEQNLKNSKIINQEEHWRRTWRRSYIGQQSDAGLILANNSKKGLHNIGADLSAGVFTGLKLVNGIQKVKFLSEHIFKSRVEHSNSNMYQITKFNSFSKRSNLSDRIIS